MPRGPIRLTASEDRTGRAPYVVWGSLGGVRRLTVLVHGYNRREDQADKTWEGTLRSLFAETGGRSHSSLALFFWPGYWTNVGLLSSLSYFRQVRKAVDCGMALADFLL